MQLNVQFLLNHIPSHLASLLEDSVGIFEVVGIVVKLLERLGRGTTMTGRPTVTCAPKFLSVTLGLQGDWWVFSCNISSSPAPPAILSTSVPSQAKFRHDGKWPFSVCTVNGASAEGRSCSSAGSRGPSRRELWHARGTGWESVRVPVRVRSKGRAWGREECRVPGIICA